MSTEQGPTGTPPPEQPAPNQIPEAGRKSEAGKPSDPGKKSADNNADVEDPHGADRRAFGEAYGRGIFRTDGPMAFLRESKVRKQHIGDVYNFYGGTRAAVRSGTIRDDYLARIRTRYVMVPGYEVMYRILSDRRLLVLYGQPGTGRLTTAVHLLDELSPGRVARFDDGQDLTVLTVADFEEKRGYIAVNEAASLTEALLDKLRDLVQARNCYCVVITELDQFKVHGLGGYALEYEPPDGSVLLERCIGAEVGTDDETDVEDLLRELAATPRLRAALGPAPRPAETAEMARLLVEFQHGKLTLEQVETQAAELVQRQVVEWFASLANARSSDLLKEALRLAAFRIALAVFNKSPYHIVAEAGVGLADGFIRTVSTTTSSSHSSLFSDDQARRLPSSRAEIVDGQAAFGQFGIPVGLAKYSDDRFPVVLLSYVWQHHHNLRAAMVDWLLNLSKDPRPTIWVRAAQATGLLCSLDFHFTYTRMISSAATARGRKRIRRRLFAAVALDQAARDERITRAISDRLKYWRRHGSEAQKWTAAAAFGYDLGRLSIDSTLEELRVLGTPTEQQATFDERNDRDLILISGYSLANLLAFGEVEPILRQLTVWITSERQSVRELAWWAVWYLIGLHGFDLNQSRMSAGRVERPPLPPSREGWPLLLALQDEKPALTEHIANLLWWHLRGRRADLVAKHLFGPWIRAGERDTECLHALIRFVPHLVHDDVDASRLRYLVTRLRRDWSDPLKDEAATLLEAAIHPTAPREEAS